MRLGEKYKPEARKMSVKRAESHLSAAHFVGCIWGKSYSALVKLILDVLFNQTMMVSDVPPEILSHVLTDRAAVSDYPILPCVLS